ncbi:hypothetical protein [Bacteroides ovatus]|nr:hypothetical protein [Bacteroides ovatus]
MVKQIVTNPMNLNYRFQSNEVSHRVVVNLVLEYFKGFYYLCF